MRLHRIQSSQLFIRWAKLARVMPAFDGQEPGALAPIPVVQMAERVVMTDGHTRAFAAWSRGLEEVPVHWDEDELDWEAYEICVA